MKEVYGQDLFVCFKDPNESSDKFGNWMANKLTNFSNQANSGYIESQNLYVCQKVSSNPFLCITAFLQKTASILSRKSMEVERSQKKMLWMMLWSFVKFFGNVEKGRGILDIMTETQWQYLSLWLNSTSADCCLSFFPYYEDAAIYSCSVFCPVI